MNARAWTLLLPLSTLLFTACGGGGDDGGGNNTPFDPFAARWTSICQSATGTNGFKYFVTFDAASGTFTGNSASSYASASCTGTSSRAGINILNGNYSVGGTVTVGGGLVATKVDFVYTSFTQSNRTDVTPADFDIVYVDPASHVIYLGQKTASKPGTSAATRPDQIDFNIAWTPN